MRCARWSADPHWLVRLCHLDWRFASCGHFVALTSEPNNKIFDVCFSVISHVLHVVKMVLKGSKVRSLTEPRFRRVLMLCFPLSPSSSSLTGLNINGGGSTGFSMGGSSPYFLKWIRQSVHSRMFSRPPWCQSLEAVNTNLSSAELCLLNITLTGSALRLAKHLMDMLRSKLLFSYHM